MAKMASATPGIGDSAVMAKTGRTWAAWVAALDRLGARDLTHRDIAKMAAQRFGLDAWWAQTVTVGYERLIGKRRIHQKADGFSATVSRTVAAAKKNLFSTWNDDRSRRALVKRMTYPSTRQAGKTLRFAWPSDNSRVVIAFYAKGPRKTQIVVQHEKLASAAAVARWKKFWSKAIDRSVAATA
jgi:hypothetical protein